MSESHGFLCPPADRATDHPDSLQESKHASRSLERIFNEISSVGVIADTGACCCRRSPACDHQLPHVEISANKPSCKSRLCLSQESNEKLITSGPPNPIITVKHDKAQLTLFYAGTVNVYDDVPADKAHAIMRNLAGTCKAWPINHSDNIGDVMTAQELLGSIRSPPFSVEAEQQLVERSLHKELPFVIPRKASLVRFLEERKKRVLAKVIKGEVKFSSHHSDGSSSTTKIEPS